MSIEHYVDRIQKLYDCQEKLSKATDALADAVVAQTIGIISFIALAFQIIFGLIQEDVSWLAIGLFALFTALMQVCVWFRFKEYKKLKAEHVKIMRELVFGEKE